MCRLIAMSKRDPIVEVNDLYVFGVLTLLSARLGNTNGIGISANTVDRLPFLKIGKPAKELVFLEPWHNWFQKVDGYKDTLIGHVRNASTEWRVQYGQNHPTEHAHPFVVGGVLVMHNGIFKEHDRLAKEVNLRDATDSHVFTAYLANQLGGAKVEDKLVEVLKQVGEAEYSLLIRQLGRPEVFVVRGNRTLYTMNTNYGLLLNTTEANLSDLAEAVNFGLAAFNLPLLEVVEKPKALPEYSLHVLNKGELQTIAEFKEVKNVNDPPKKYTNTTTKYNYGWQANYDVEDYQTIAGEIDVEEAIARVEALVKLFGLSPKVSEETHRLTLKELTGHDLLSVANYEAIEIGELTDLLKWAWETKPELAPNEEKEQLWLAFSTASHMSGLITVESLYVLAKEVLGRDFDVPYFHNEVIDLQDLALIAGT